ncbi:SRRM1 [Mytilus coruscus]|uniref:SRRM1 n=1 Tax=Mytilus coruscus TaxID=42192 RepID=A0A6J8A3C7_MYTCO|nr:SRRM1 [Mytilus coruscus]
MSSHVQSVNKLLVRPTVNLNLTGTSGEKENTAEGNFLHQVRTLLTKIIPIERVRYQGKEGVLNRRKCQSLPFLAIYLFGNFLRERQKEVARLIVETNHRTISESLKWTKSSLAYQKASYGASMTYAGSPQSYSQRQVIFPYMNDSDHCQQRPPASQNSQTVEKVVNVLQFNIKDLISVVNQLLKDESSNRPSSPAVHREYYNSPLMHSQSIFVRSPTPPRSELKFWSPQNSHSPSPQRGSMTGKEQDNMPLKRTKSLTFQRTSSSNSPKERSLNRSGSGH